MFKLECRAQNYAWGKKGRASKVAELISATQKIDETEPYAELWMGTHPNAPSQVAGRPLKDMLDAKVLSPGIHAKFNDLPFLFKVLSVNKALSIQAHPDKTLAKQLYAAQPQNYKDDNHKPEMAVAITEFEAMVGFRPVSEISAFLGEFEELRNVVGNAEAEALIKSTAGNAKSALRDVFKNLMEAKLDIVTKNLDSLLEKIKKRNPIPKTLDEVLIRLNTQYPGDVGCFCIFFLNYVVLQPGEGIFLGANEPHAYLSGDCVECMAASDNVVRAGLTPKYKDVETLVNMLTYNHGPASKQILKGEPYKNSKTSRLYDPPIEEFSIIRTELGKDQVEYFDGVPGPSIIIVTEGTGKLSQNDVATGDVYFVSAGTPVELHSKSANSVFYRAFCCL